MSYRDIVAEYCPVPEDGARNLLCSGCPEEFQLRELTFRKPSGERYHFTCLFFSENFKGDVKSIRCFHNLSMEDQRELMGNLPSTPEPEPIAVDTGEQLKFDQQSTSAVSPGADSTDDIVLVRDTDDCQHEKNKNDSFKPKPPTMVAPRIPRFTFKPTVRVKDTKSELVQQESMLVGMREEVDQLSLSALDNLLRDSGYSNLVEASASHSDKVDVLVDIALFGVPQCPDCPRGDVRFCEEKQMYVCHGFMSEYSSCLYNHRNPIRKPFVINRNHRILVGRFNNANVKINSLSKRAYPTMAEGAGDISVHSGTSALASQTVLLNSTVSEVGIKKIIENRHILKKGTVVDGEFQYASVCYVHQDPDGHVYSTVLSSADIGANTNSYCKIQLLKHDEENVYYVFVSWGRTGTDIGDTATERWMSEKPAVRSFHNWFFEKTGNNWEDRKYFRKKAGLFGMVETDYSEYNDLDEDRIHAVVPGSQTKLHRSIKELVMMIFDVEQMKSAMQSFNLDVDKMPVGKLSKSQLKKAYTVLQELQKLLDVYHTPGQVMDMTNRFFTLVPHNFGMEAPPPLDSIKMIKEKCDMLDALLEITVAYDMVRESKRKSLGVHGEDPVDSHYRGLRCAMQYVDPSSDEFKLVHNYVTNTHGHSHSGFKLKIVDVISLERRGEDANFANEIGNRMLLWHGSAMTNYAGILSQGLRIAPPEAPASGYMFGKGIYFADMVSKSANYCRIKHYNDDGLLLLCEVAVGKAKGERFAKAYARAPDGFDSILGEGQTCPDPSATIVDEKTGYSIPLGTPTVQLTGQHQTDFALLYNEYIVYDVRQVRLKYLVRAKFARNTNKT